VQARFVLGSGRDWKDLPLLSGSARKELLESADGPPLLFVTPKNKPLIRSSGESWRTRSSKANTRLHVLSFRAPGGICLRLVAAVRARDALGEEGRLMVLRSLAGAAPGKKLKVLSREAARLAGFFGAVEFRLAGIPKKTSSRQPCSKKIVGKVRDFEGLAWKMQDLAAVLDLYTQWLNAHDLKDADSLLRPGR